MFACVCGTPGGSARVKASLDAKIRGNEDLFATVRYLDDEARGPQFGVMLSEDLLLTTADAVPSAEAAARIRLCLASAATSGAISSSSARRKVGKKRQGKNAVATDGPEAAAPELALDPQRLFLQSSLLNLTVVALAPHKGSQSKAGEGRRGLLGRPLAPLPRDGQPTAYLLSPAQDKAQAILASARNGTAAGSSSAPGAVLSCAVTKGKLTSSADATSFEAPRGIPADTPEGAICLGLNGTGDLAFVASAAGPGGEARTIPVSDIQHWVVSSSEGPSLDLIQGALKAGLRSSARLARQGSAASAKVMPLGGPGLAGTHADVIGRPLAVAEPAAPTGGAQTGDSAAARPALPSAVAMAMAAPEADRAMGPDTGAVSTTNVTSVGGSASAATGFQESAVPSAAEGSVPAATVGDASAAVSPSADGSGSTGVPGPDGSAGAGLEVTGGVEKGLPDGRPSSHVAAPAASTSLPPEKVKERIQGYGNTSSISKHLVGPARGQTPRSISILKQGKKGVGVDVSSAVGSSSWPASGGKVTPDTLPSSSSTLASVAQGGTPGGAQITDNTTTATTTISKGSPSAAAPTASSPSASAPAAEAIRAGMSAADSALAAPGYTARAGAEASGAAAGALHQSGSGDKGKEKDASAGSKASGVHPGATAAAASQAPHASGAVGLGEDEASAEAGAAVRAGAWGGEGSEAAAGAGKTEEVLAPEKVKARIQGYGNTSSISKHLVGPNRRAGSPAPSHSNSPRTQQKMPPASAGKAVAGGALAVPTGHSAAGGAPGNTSGVPDSSGQPGPGAGSTPGSTGGVLEGSVQSVPESASTHGSASGAPESSVLAMLSTPLTLLGTAFASLAGQGGSSITAGGQMAASAVDPSKGSPAERASAGTGKAVVGPSEDEEAKQERDNVYKTAFTKIFTPKPSPTPAAPDTSALPSSEAKGDATGTPGETEGASAKAAVFPLSKGSPRPIQVGSTPEEQLASELAGTGSPVFSQPVGWQGGQGGQVGGTPGGIESVGMLRTEFEKRRELWRQISVGKGTGITGVRGGQGMQGVTVWGKGGEGGGGQEEEEEDNDWGQKGVLKKPRTKRRQAPAAPSAVSRPAGPAGRIGTTGAGAHAEERASSSCTGAWVRAAQELTAGAPRSGAPGLQELAEPKAAERGAGSAATMGRSAPPTRIPRFPTRAAQAVPPATGASGATGVPAVTGAPAATGVGSSATRGAPTWARGISRSGPLATTSSYGVLACAGAGHGAAAGAGAGAGPGAGQDGRAASAPVSETPPSAAATAAPVQAGGDGRGGGGAMLRSAGGLSNASSGVTQALMEEAEQQMGRGVPLYAQGQAQGQAQGHGQAQEQGQAQAQEKGSGSLARISDSGSTESSGLSEQSSPGTWSETEALGVRLEGRQGTPQPSGRARGGESSDEGEVYYESPASSRSTGSSGSEAGASGGGSVKKTGGRSSGGGSGAKGGSEAGHADGASVEKTGKRSSGGGSGAKGVSAVSRPAGGGGGIKGLEVRKLVGGSDVWRKVLTGPAVEEAIGRRKLVHRLSGEGNTSPEGQSASPSPSPRPMPSPRLSPRGTPQDATGVPLTSVPLSDVPLDAAPGLGGAPRLGGALRIGGTPPLTLQSQLSSISSHGEEEWGIEEEEEKEEEEEEEEEVYQDSLSSTPVGYATGHTAGHTAGHTVGHTGGTSATRGSSHSHSRSWTHAHAHSHSPSSSGSDEVYLTPTRTPTTEDGTGSSRGSTPASDSKLRASLEFAPSHNKAQAQDQASTQSQKHGEGQGQAQRREKGQGEAHSGTWFGSAGEGQGVQGQGIQGQGIQGQGIQGQGIQGQGIQGQGSQNVLQATRGSLRRTGSIEGSGSGIAALGPSPGGEKSQKGSKLGGVARTGGHHASVAAAVAAAEAAGAAKAAATAAGAANEMVLSVMKGVSDMADSFSSDDGAGGSGSIRPDSTGLSSTGFKSTGADENGLYAASSDVASPTVTSSVPRAATETAPLSTNNSAMVSTPVPASVPLKATVSAPSTASSAPGTASSAPSTASSAPGTGTGSAPEAVGVSGTGSMPSATGGRSAGSRGPSSEEAGGGGDGNVARVGVGNLILAAAGAFAGLTPRAPAQTDTPSPKTGAALTPSASAARPFRGLVYQHGPDHVSSLLHKSALCHVADRLEVYAQATGTLTLEQQAQWLWRGSTRAQLIVPVAHLGHAPATHPGDIQAAHLGYAPVGSPPPGLEQGQAVRRWHVPSGPPSRGSQQAWGAQDTLGPLFQALGQGVEVPRVYLEQQRQMRASPLPCTCHRCHTPPGATSGSPPPTCPPSCYSRTGGYTPQLPLLLQQDLLRAPQGPPQGPSGQLKPGPCLTSPPSEGPWDCASGSPVGVPGTAAGFQGGAAGVCKMMAGPPYEGPLATAESLAGVPGASAGSVAGAPTTAEGLRGVKLGLGQMGQMQGPLGARGCPVRVQIRGHATGDILPRVTAGGSCMEASGADNPAGGTMAVFTYLQANGQKCGRVGFRATCGF